MFDFKKTGSNKGQALIECLILFLTLASLLQFLFVLTWIFINLIWMKHHLYQAIVCTAQNRGKFFCEERLLKDIRVLNPPAQITGLNFNDSKGEFKWRFYKKNFVIRQSFKLSP